MIRQIAPARVSWVPHKLHQLVSVGCYINLKNQIMWKSQIPSAVSHRHVLSDVPVTTVSAQHVMWGARDSTVWWNHFMYIPVTHWFFRSFHKYIVQTYIVERKVLWVELTRLVILNFLYVLKLCIKNKIYALGLKSDASFEWTLWNL
jgi:hypothetical protein